MILSISEILEKISALDTVEKRKEALAKYGKTNQALLKILQLAFDENIVFNLPKTDPPYKPCQFPDQQAMLYNQLKRFYLFIGAGNPKITKTKKESLFIQMLESIDPRDAELVLSVKKKKIPYKGISRKLVESVFPDLLSKTPVA
jgi:Family of unknown function (DUF6433)